jgi:hypothetical protein
MIRHSIRFLPVSLEDRPLEPELPRTEELSVHTSELDAIEAGRPVEPRSSARGRHSPPHVRLGNLAEGGIAPAVAAIVERGVRRRPALATGLKIEVELGIDGPYPPVRIVFGERLVLVEDGPATAPDLKVEGGLTDLISMMVAPIGFGGVPSLINPKGRAALGKVVLGHVRIEGRLGLMRRLLGLMRF